MALDGRVPRSRGRSAGRGRSSYRPESRPDSATSIWLVTSEAALAIGLVSGRPAIALLCSMGWGALILVRSDVDETSNQRPLVMLCTTAACLFAAALEIRSATGAVIVFISWIPLVGAASLWGGYARARRRAVTTREKLDAAAFLSRHASITRQATALGELEHRVRDRMRGVRDEARTFLETLGDSSVDAGGLLGIAEHAPDRAPSRWTSRACRDPAAGRPGRQRTAARARPPSQSGSKTYGAI